MTFIPNTPTPKLPFANWQIQFIDNFTQMANAFSKNHVALDAVSNAGNHTILQMYEQTEPQQVNLSELAAYSKDVPGQTDQLFLRYQGNGVEFQYTNYQIYTIAPTDTQTSYFTFLPGGILVYFGHLNSTLNRDARLTLKPPVAKNIISVSLTPDSPLTESGPPSGGQAFGIIKPTNGIITALTIKTTAPTYYLVLANI